MKGEEDLLEISRRAGIELDSVCGGKGTCGRCRVIIKGLDSPLTDDEEKHLSKADISMGMRLACRVIPQEDLIVEVPTEFIRERSVILEESIAESKVDPCVRSVVLSVAKASLENQVGDLERIIASFPEHEEKPSIISIELLRSIPSLLKAGEPMNAVTRGKEILDLKREGDRVLGVAVDIGTTTVVAYLVDLPTGEVLAVKSAMNPQIAHGDDVVSRITFTMANDNGLHELQREIIGCLNQLIESCTVEAGAILRDIHEVVVVGNTAMHHLFFGLNPSSLALSPYIPVVAGSIEERGVSLGINMGRGYVYSLPNIAGFVGADHVGALLASRIWERERPTLVIDIGTNGEISLGNKDGIISASCAAGPAFEGASLKCGIRGVPGAIDHLTIDDDVHYSTIGGLSPKGICGSGAVDAVWEMFKAGVIDQSGRIIEELDIPRIRVIDGQSEFVIATGEESAMGEPIVITQDDIVSIQYAKSALYVGATLLMDELDVSTQDIDKVFLAGAFGNYVSIGSTRNIGVIPEIPLERIESIGNAAGAGAKIALLDKACRERAKELSKWVRYLELAAHPEFEERFYEAMFIPHFEPSLFPEVEALISQTRTLSNPALGRNSGRKIN
ncbi:MAG: DUF4445 domain-containing protein [Methanomassiliicoccales archaeon]|nr:DUF4445 domain-containing protein [Methanomassiliicoccales archaeon]NYT15891.1 DUF4445 domain-containing protein [Methanomassiliicoccales archaeon]